MRFAGCQVFPREAPSDAVNELPGRTFAAIVWQGVSTFLDTIPYANATVIVGAGKQAASYAVPKATLNGMYPHVSPDDLRRRAPARRPQAHTGWHLAAYHAYCSPPSATAPPFEGDSFLSEGGLGGSARAPC